MKASPRASAQDSVSKLSRAYIQLLMLQQQVQVRFPPGKLWPLTVREHRTGLEYRFYLGDIPPIDPDWAVATSEILFNIRCSLDYLAFQLHVRRYGQNMPPAAEKASMFPVSADKSDFNKSGKRHIRYLSARDQQAIRHLQPYVTRADGWKYTRHFLGLLSSLHNTDKHRKLNVVTVAQAGSFTPDFPASCGFRADLASVPLSSGSHVQTWTFTSPPPEMKGNDGIILAAAIEQAGQLMAVPGVLGDLADNVSYVIERFADRFPRIPRPVAWRADWNAPYVPEGARPPLLRSLFS